MSHPVQEPKTLRFCSVLYQENKISLEKVKEHCGNYQQSIIFHHRDFPMAQYYSEEMGEKDSLKRIFIVDPRTSSPKALIKDKINSYEIERITSENEHRIINIDPGIISLSNMQLATFKSYSHRVYLDSGVYSELCYTFENKSFKALPWTYPDYQTTELIEFFNWSRSLMF